VIQGRGAGAPVVFRGVLAAEDVCKYFESIYGCTYRLYNRNRKLAQDRLVAEMTELNLRPVEKEEQTHPEEEQIHLLD
ncbi:hypothetical protein GBAR_LOCUS11752, partial [Geodia barretti]